jgi:putative membrane protein
MTTRKPVFPFELDPRTLDPTRIELVEEADHAQLPQVAPLPPPPRRTRLLTRLFLGSLALLLLVLLGLEAYDGLEALYARSTALGAIVALLLAAALAGGLGLAAREVVSLRRLDRVEEVRQEAATLVGAQLHGKADALLERIGRLYRGRPQTLEAIERFERQASDALDDGERLQLFASTVLAPIDRRAYQLVRNGARDIGALTAFSPFGLLDGVIVLWRTTSMLRQIATLYGVRPGAAATVGLMRRSIRNVLVAGVGELVSDAAVETAGASLLSVLSARAGQGAINGLLAAKLGLSAMQLCRPLPFLAGELPSLRQLRREIFAESVTERWSPRS